MKSLKQLIPSPIKKLIKLFLLIYKAKKEFRYDARSLIKVKNPFRKDYKDIEAELFMATHVVEKGLSLKHTRLGYGKQQIYYILELVRNYIKTGCPQNNTVIMFSLGVLKAYTEFHRKNNYDLDKIGIAIDNLVNEVNIKLAEEYAGVIHITKPYIDKIRESSNFRDFFNTRYSVRNYSDKNIDIEVIKNAISLAQKSPSACNMQPVRVYIIQDENLKDGVLALHKGHRGFGDMANKILVITSDSICFHVNERHQAYIDGGIFTCSLLLSLHYHGIGSCVLQWTAERKRDTILRNMLCISESEKIIVLITIGYYPDEFDVAKSMRKSTEEIVYVK